MHINLVPILVTLSSVNHLCENGTEGDLCGGPITCHTNSPLSAITIRRVAYGIGTVISSRFTSSHGQRMLGYSQEWQMWLDLVL